MSENDNRDSVGSHCYALIPYRPPDHFSAIEAATFDHGTHEERLAVLNAVCARSLGVPPSVIQSDETNCSSVKYDSERYRRWSR